MIEVIDGYTPREAGKYSARVVEVSIVDGKHGKTLKWVLEWVDDPEAPHQWALCSAQVKPRTKPGRWVSAALGRELGVGEQIDEKSLAGAVVAVEVEVVDGSNRVTNILPATIAWVPPSLSEQVRGAASEEELASLVPEISRLPEEEKEILRAEYTARLATLRWLA